MATAIESHGAQLAQPLAGLRSAQDAAGRL
jgi:hypothetical protein